MAAAPTLSAGGPVPAWTSLSSRTQDNLIRLAVLIGAALIWEGLARSGLLYRDVVPPLERIVKALAGLLVNPAFYANLAVTATEVTASLAIGSTLGITVGILIGANRFLAAAYEPFLYYLAPTPRIIFFPVMIMWFGVGIASKIALGALSSFFTVALSTAAGMRQVDPVLVRVGASFRATPLQMATKIYMPAMRVPILTGIRLGFGNAFISALLAETKLSNQGLGYMIMQVYARFDMPSLYALLIIAFVIAGLCNQLLGRLAEQGR